MLTEIIKGKGVHSFEKELIIPNKPPILAVHPYFIPRTPEYLNYFKNLEKTIQTNDTLIITLEEWPKIEKTAKHYRSLGKKKNAIFIETIHANPIPKKMEWDSLIDFLKNFKKPFRLIGG